MATMTDREAMERFSHGLKKAADLSRKLARIRSSKSWDQLAEQLDVMRLNGEHLYRVRPLTQQEVFHKLDRIQDKERDKAEKEGRVTQTLVH